MELAPDILERLREQLPEWVERVEPREALNADGESILLLFLVVSADAAVLADAAELSALDETVARVFQENRVGIWPYVRFVDADEWRRAAQA